MPFITAARIHDGQKWLPEGTVIEIAEDGAVVALHDSSKEEEATFYDGILCPGFVNVHCHLELSHMKGVIPEHTGLIPFLQTVTFHRNDTDDLTKKIARINAYEELVSNGIVAVGDIANTLDMLPIRGVEKLHIHTFVEAIGFADEHAQIRFDHAATTYNTYADQEFENKRLHQSIVPHAPYSVSKTLFSLIDEYHPTSIVSIHNQEAEAENQFYINKEGAVNDLLEGFKIDASAFVPSGKTSLQTYHSYFSLDHTFIFVHNTFTAQEDVDYMKMQDCAAYWCLCPNANLYIENKLPDVMMLVQNCVNICIGTDSLASNHQLSVIAELYTLKQNFPSLDWETLLAWGTYNGAQALKMDDVVGSITIGMKPGIVQLMGLEDGAPIVKRIV